LLNGFEGLMCRQFTPFFLILSDFGVRFSKMINWYLKFFVFVHFKEISEIFDFCGLILCNAFISKKVSFKLLLRLYGYSPYYGLQCSSIWLKHSSYCFLFYNWVLSGETRLVSVISVALLSNNEKCGWKKYV